MQHYRTHTQIANDIRCVLKERKLTLRECVDLYNQTYAEDISKQRKRALNKDFVQRIRSGKCKVVSSRVVDLCAFLGVETHEKAELGTTDKVSRELKNIENLIHQHPFLENSMVKLLQDVIRLAKLNLSSDKAI